MFDNGEFALTLNATNGSITSGPIGLLSTPAGVDLDATQAISVGDVTINDGPINIDAGTDLTAGNVTIASGGNASSEPIRINAGGNINVGNVAAIDGLSIIAGGSLTGGDLRGTGATATAGGAVDLGNVLIFNGVANGDNITISGTAVSVLSATANTATGNTIDIDASSGPVTIGSADSCLLYTSDAADD